MNKTVKAFISLVINCILLVIPYAICRNAGTFPGSVKLAVPYVAYAFFGLTLFFGWWYNRSRVFFTALTLIIGQIAVSSNPPAGIEKVFYNNVVLTAVSIFVPLNIIVFSMLKERGIISLWGRIRFIFIISEMLIASWIIWYNDTDLLQLLNLRVFPMKNKLLPGFPQLSVLLFISAISYFVLRQSVTGKNNDSPFMGITILSFSALVLRNDAYAVPVFFAAAGLLMLIIVLHASHAMAYLDELTGLPSRRALKEEMLKLGGQYAIAMLDIDHFKKFNDTHGHDVGDEVLRLVASCIKRVEGGGKAFRYGGEEFTILFPAKDVNEAIPYLEELREHIANRGFVKRGRNRPKEKPKETTSKPGGYKKLFVTISIGVAERSEKYRTADEVAVAADHALYRAKSKGRNCVSK